MRLCDRFFFFIFNKLRGNRFVKKCFLSRAIRNWRKTRHSGDLWRRARPFPVKKEADDDDGVLLPNITTRYFWNFVFFSVSTLCVFCESFEYSNFMQMRFHLIWNDWLGFGVSMTLRLIFFTLIQLKWMKFPHSFEYSNFMQMRNWIKFSLNFFLVLFQLKLKKIPHCDSFEYSNFMQMRNLIQFQI